MGTVITVTHTHTHTHTRCRRLLLYIYDTVRWSHLLSTFRQHLIVSKKTAFVSVILFNRLLQLTVTEMTPVYSTSSAKLLHANALSVCSVIFPYLVVR